MIDREKEYDRDIAPLVSDLVDLCRRHGLHLLVSVSYLGAKGGAKGLCTTHIPAPTRELTCPALYAVVDYLTQGTDRSGSTLQ